MVGRTGVTVVNSSVVPHNHVVFNLNGGQASLWDVDTQGNVTEHLYGPYFDAPANPKAPWSITAVASAPDGTQRLLWNNTDSRVMLWTVDAKGDMLSVTGYGPYTDDSQPKPRRTSGTPSASRSAQTGHASAVGQHGPPDDVLERGQRRATCSASWGTGRTPTTGRTTCGTRRP